MCLLTWVCFDVPLLYELAKNHFCPLFIHWPDLFLSKSFPCLVLSFLHHVFASVGQASSLTPPLPRFPLPLPTVSLFKEKQDYNGTWWDFLNYTAGKLSLGRSLLGKFYSVAAQEYCPHQHPLQNVGGEDIARTAPQALLFMHSCLWILHEGQILSLVYLHCFSSFYKYA